MSNGKIDTFIGFCVKARKITYGSGAIGVLRGGVYLVIVSADAAKNTQKLAIKYKNRFNCPLLICKSDFERIVNKYGCKIAAIKDNKLARAIIENINNYNESNYELYAGGAE